MKKERGGEISKTHEYLARNDPDFTEIYDKLFEVLWTKKRTLPTKVKELVVIAILASKGQYDALRTHIRRAREKGVSPQEILETLENTMLYGGAEALIHGGLELLKVLEEEAKRPQGSPRRPQRRSASRSAHPRRP